MNTCMITAELVHTKLRKRKREIHKGDCGRVLLVAGSEGMMGAAVLAARAALRSGAGLVQLAVPEPLFPVAQIAVPEATCRPRSFSPEDLARYDAVAVGSGLGKDRESVEAVRTILEFYEGPLVLDADALNIIADPENQLYLLLRIRKGDTVITPHIGEAQRLLKAAENGDQYFARSAEERQTMAQALVELTGSTVVLKGWGSLVATEGEKTYTNTTGNPGMATGGSGDVLTGIIAGLWGQTQTEPDGTARKLTAHEAAVCGVFVHGLAGDLAAEELGEYGMIAGDIAGKTPLALKRILEG